MSRGGSILERQKTKEYNMAQIVDILRKNSGKPVSSVTVSKEMHNRGIDISFSTVKHYCAELTKEYPEITSSTGIGYIWAKEEAEFYDKKAADATENKSAYRKKSPVMRNSEGYADPTAGVAIRNTEGDDPYARLGEVWSVKGANGLVEWFMILSDWGAVRIGLPLYSGDYRSRIRVKVDVAGAVLYGDATNLRSKPSKYFDTYMGNVEDKKAKAILDDVLMAICDPDISPTVIEAVMPANTITVDGVLYTEADVKSKIDSVDILMSQHVAHLDEVADLNNKLSEADTKVKELENVINSLRTALATARKNAPITIQVDGEIYNEEDITAIIRARNTIRVGDKVYKASDICELLERKNESAPVPDKAYVDKVVAMATIYKQFFDAYCQGMAKGETE